MLRGSMDAGRESDLSHIHADALVQAIATIRRQASARAPHHTGSRSLLHYAGCLITQGLDQPCLEQGWYGANIQEPSPADIWLVSTRSLANASTWRVPLSPLLWRPCGCEGVARSNPYHAAPPFHCRGEVRAWAAGRPPNFPARAMAGCTGAESLPCSRGRCPPGSDAIPADFWRALFLGPLSYGEKDHFVIDDR